eukprot:6207554-Pleurochrysis_carterae.AAC.5
MRGAVGAVVGRGARVVRGAAAGREALLRGAMSTFTVDVREWPAAFSQHRVAIVTGSYDTQVDGVALTLNRLAAHLLRQGHEVRARCKPTLHCEHLRLLITRADNKLGFSYLPQVMVICPGKGNSAIIKPASEDITRVPSLPLPIWCASNDAN